MSRHWGQTLDSWKEGKLSVVSPSILLESGAWVASLDLNQSSGTAQNQNCRLMRMGMRFVWGLLILSVLLGVLRLSFVFVGVRA